MNSFHMNSFEFDDTTPSWEPAKGVSGYMTRTGTLLQTVRTISCYEEFEGRMINIPTDTVILAISCKEKWNPSSGRNRFKLLGLMNEREVLLCFDNYHDYYLEYGNSPSGGMKKHNPISLATYFQSIYSPPDTDT